MNILTRAAALALAFVVVAGCSQRDPAEQAIKAAEDALNTVYDDAQKYLPDQYAEVKASLDSARKAFEEERYADAIATVKDVPARAEQLGKDVVVAKQKRLAELNSDWTRLSASLPPLMTNIGGRLDELGKMRRLPQGMDKQLLEEANAAYGSAKGAWDEASGLFAGGDIEGAVGKAKDVEGMAQDLMTRLGMTQAG